MAKKYQIAWLTGDGIGQEVMEAARLVLDRLELPAEYLPGDIGWEFWRTEGDALPQRTLELLGRVDAAMFGAITSKPAKAAEQVAHIALTLALLDDIDVGVIRPRYVANAIALSEFYTSEALRLFNVAPVEEVLQRAIDLGKWLARQGKSELTTRAIYKWGPRSIRSKKAALEALKILEDHYWVTHDGSVWEVADGLPEICD